MSFENRNSENISTIAIWGALGVSTAILLALNNLVGKSKVNECTKQGLETRVIPAKVIGRTYQPPMYYCDPKTQPKSTNQSDTKSKISENQPKQTTFGQN